MCQTIGTCYVESKENVLVKLREDISCFLFRNPHATTVEISEFVAHVCSNNLCKVENLLEYFKRDLEIAKELANDPKELNAMREIQQMYCRDYERVLTAIK